jgi:hypothetical protein
MKYRYIVYVLIAFLSYLSRAERYAASVQPAKPAIQRATENSASSVLRFKASGMPATPLMVILGVYAGRNLVVSDEFAGKVIDMDVANIQFDDLINKVRTGIGADMPLQCAQRLLCRLKPYGTTRHLRCNTNQPRLQ